MAKSKRAREEAGPQTEGGERDPPASPEDGADGGDSTGEGSDETTDGARAPEAGVEAATEQVPQDGVPIVPPEGAAPLQQYAPTERTLSAEVAQLSREALNARDFTAHAELHAIEMAVAHLRQAALKAAPRVKGDARDFVELLLAGL